MGTMINMIYDPEKFLEHYLKEEEIKLKEKMSEILSDDYSTHAEKVNRLYDFVLLEIPPSVFSK